MSVRSRIGSIGSKVVIGSYSDRVLNCCSNCDMGVNWEVWRFNCCGGVIILNYESFYRGCIRWSSSRDLDFWSVQMCAC